MITEQLQKSNFSGKDGFSWWIGRVAHPKYWKIQNLAIGFAGSSDHRVKVRIIGYHPWDDTLPENDLPWAQVMMDPVSGSGQGSMGDTLNLAGGETAIGFFSDGEEAQQPVIIGLLHRSSEATNPISESEIFDSNSSQFKPFTGYGASGSTLSRIPAGTKKTAEVIIDPVIKDNGSKEVEAGKVEKSSVRESSTTLHDKDNNGVASAAHQAFVRDNTKEQNKPSTCEDNVIGDISQALTDFVAFSSVLESFQGNFVDPLTNAIVDMEQQIRDTADAVQRIIKKALNNIPVSYTHLTLPTSDLV